MTKPTHGLSCPTCNHYLYLHAGNSGKCGMRDFQCLGVTVDLGGLVETNSVPDIDKKTREIVLDWFDRHKDGPAPESYSIQLIIDSVRHHTTDEQNYERGYSRGFYDAKAPNKIAALFVMEDGPYSNVPGVDAWDITRDARSYRGPWPVVAHPPCQRWGKFWAGQPLHIKKTGERKIKGDDAGCFQSALLAVRSLGGVLEHPEGSHAWVHFGLRRPPRLGGWIAADQFGGFTCCVEQGRYGHYARKPTWLLAYRCDLPELNWGKSLARLDPKVIERMGLKRAQRLGEVSGRGGGVDSPERNATPFPFRDLLISMARSVDCHCTGVTVPNETKEK